MVRYSHKIFACEKKATKKNTISCLQFMHVFRVSICVSPFTECMYQLTPAGLQPDFFSHAEHHYKTSTKISVGLMQWKSPFERWQLVCFHSNTIFLTIHYSLLYSRHIHTIWKRPVEKYESKDNPFT